MELSSTDSDSERPEHPTPMDSPPSPVVLPSEMLHQFGVSPGMMNFLTSKLLVKKIKEVRRNEAAKNDTDKRNRDTS